MIPGALKGEDWPDGVPQCRGTDPRARPAAPPSALQLRRLLESGRQVPLITTHSRMPVEQIAGALFSRWSQENRRRGRGLEPQPSPRRQRSGAQSPSPLPATPGTLRNRIADSGAQSHQTAEAGRLQARIDALDAEREALKQKRSDTQRHITVPTSTRPWMREGRPRVIA